MTLKKFPENKYHFSKHLIDPGDYVVTQPFKTKHEARAIAKAAYYWAWNHRRVVKVNVQPHVDGTYSTTITLVSKHRKREYE